MSESENERYIATQTLYILNFSDTEADRIAYLMSDSPLAVPDVGEEVDFEEIEFGTGEDVSESILDGVSEVVDKSIEYKYVTKDDNDEKETNSDFEASLLHVTNVVVDPV